jgi:hypothetical protein
VCLSKPVRRFLLVSATSAATARTAFRVAFRIRSISKTLTHKRGPQNRYNAGYGELAGEDHR